MENAQALQERSQALDRELARVLMKISDTAERAARHIMILRQERKAKGVKHYDKGNVGQIIR
ncbi:hypothetical protein LK430_08510 [Acidaminococcus fermentans DSM 20731]|uniref:Uncharacterized protein n=1 Tax=Acidaminococcus fermentans (strain ATCC 25085 / DSM 20731 / CCUG 9996 / CIP 106432 / VR4) TaxID=591001 RepID=D2RKA1_ACIFV|nr:hypothetical protein [Acidaminococcus fermentans]ADB47503.1 hypothetical protein Acfer_1136 [Acidaminococcus fermentans DSM 20731]UEA71883.1 hypothetical protein LK430_08510 [Acidaminococcus fermentans DSM 20731]